MKNLDVTSFVAIVSKPFSVKLNMINIQTGHIAINLLLDNIYVRFGNTVYRQVIGIPMGTNCTPLIADLFLYCYESQFMAKIYKDPKTRLNR